MESLVIVNPRSGSVDDASELLATLRDHPSTRGSEIRVTSGPEDASELARRARNESRERIVVVGGDGTVNEVLNGLGPAPQGPVLAVLPLGTGNDFARSLGVPLDLDTALDRMADAVVRPVDVVRVSGSVEKLCLNASAGGFSGQVDDELTPEVKRSWGPLAYLRSAVEVLPDPTTWRLTLRFDDEEPMELEALNLVAANGRTVAGGIPVAPEARVDDGALEVIVVRAAPMSRLAGLGPRCMVGKHLDHELVVYRRATRLEVEADPAMPFNVDGERVGTTPLRYEVQQGALRMLAPAAEDAAFGTAA